MAEHILLADTGERVGKALLVLYRSRLFHQEDKRIGGIGARQYRRTGTVQPWIVSIWEPRLMNYEKELNEIKE